MSVKYTCMNCGNVWHGSTAGRVAKGSFQLLSMIAVAFSGRSSYIDVAKARDDWQRCPFCGVPGNYNAEYETQQSTLNPEQKTEMGKGCIGCLVLIAILAGIGALIDKCSSTDEATQGTEKTEAEKRKAYAVVDSVAAVADSIVAVAQAKEQLAIYLNDKFFGGISSEKALTLMPTTQIIESFAILGKATKAYEKIPDDEIKKMAAQARSKLKKEQQKVFPLLRKEFAKVFSENFRNIQVKVKAAGNGNTRLEFINKGFASKKFIEECHLAFAPGSKNLEGIKQFRFKRIAYKRNEYDEEYTYYEYDTPDDAAVE